MIYSKKILLIATLLSLALATYHWLPGPQQNLPANIVESNADFYFSEVEINSYSRAGQLVNQVKAESMEYFKDASYSLMEKPQVNATPNSDIRWVFIADKGRFEHQSEQLFLPGSVSIERFMGGKERVFADSKAVTTDLLVDFDKKQISSDKMAIIESDKFITQGNGLSAQLDQQTITLLSQVTTRSK